MRYAVVIEKGERNYSAYVPDLPGCVAAGDSLDQVKADIREAIAVHTVAIKSACEIITGVHHEVPKPGGFCDNVSR